jgi:hypothetical protein
MIKWDKDWVLNADRRLKDPTKSSVFRLEKIELGPFVTYAVNFNAGDMTDLWKNVRLLQRGTESLVHRGPLLPRWDPNDAAVRTQYEKAIAEDIRHTTANTEVLVGVVRDGQQLLFVVFFLIPYAVNGDAGVEDLLAVKWYGNLKSTSPGEDGGGEIDDGTGHGNSP